MLLQAALIQHQPGSSRLQTVDAKHGVTRAAAFRHGRACSLPQYAPTISQVTLIVDFMLTSVRASQCMAASCSYCGCLCPLSTPHHCWHHCRHRHVPLASHWRAPALLTVLNARVVHKLGVDGVLPHQRPHLRHNLQQCSSAAVDSIGPLAGGCPGCTTACAAAHVAC